MSSVASSALVSSAPATVLEVSVSHEDSAISHPRDQDYLSLWVGKGVVRWSCSKALWGCVRAARRNRDPERGCAGLASYNIIFTNSSDYAGASRPWERHEKNDAYGELEGARRNKDGKGVT